MEEEVKKLKELIESSERILITSHISPDPDAVTSLLILGTTLKSNFPDKKVLMVLEEEPLDLGFLSGYDDIQFANLEEAVKSFQPQLIIGLDGNNFNRLSRFNGDGVRKFIQQEQVKTALVDHHEAANKDESNVFINRMQPATAQTIYEVLFQDIRMTRPEGAVESAMTGFYADTGGFTYLKAGESGPVFKFAEELVAAGADVEAVKNKLTQYAEADMKVLAELAGNLTHEHDYSYSFIQDSFIVDWTKDGKNPARLQKACGIFLDEFIRNIDGRKWGFIVYKNTLQGDDIYSASFRSEAGARDVSLVANALGGGGHKPAAGAKFPAGSAKDAVNKVNSAISST